MSAAKRTSAQQPSAPATVWADGAAPSSRLVEIVAGAVIGVISGFVLIGTHRLQLPVGGSDIPVGLIFGAVFQCVGSVLLAAWFGRKMPLGVLSLVFAVLAMLFAGPSAGGGILMPGELAGEFQWQGWAVQLIGILVPLAVLTVMWIIQIRQISRAARDRAGERAHT